MNFAWDHHNPLSHAMHYGHVHAPAHHGYMHHAMPYAELQNLDSSLNLQGLSPMIELDDREKYEYTLDISELDNIEGAYDKNIAAGTEVISLAEALQKNVEYNNALKVQKRLLGMIKTNVLDFIELFQIKSKIFIDDKCGIHFKLTHIPDNVYSGDDQPLKHQQEILFSFMVVKSIMDNFLLSDLANAITVENKDFVHNVKVLKDLPYDALQFTLLEADDFKKFNQTNNIFPPLTEITNEIMNKTVTADQAVFQDDQPLTSEEEKVVAGINKDDDKAMYTKLYNYRTSSFSASFKKLDLAVRQLLRAHPIKPAPKKPEPKKKN